MPPEAREVLIDEQQIQRRIGELAQEIRTDYQGKVPLFVGVLRGAVIFHADLVRQVDLDLMIDFISVSSYGAATESSGEVRLLKDLEGSIEGQDVILVEDIVDTGLTLQYLLRSLKARRPASLRVCSLLSKPSRRRVDVAIDYLGFEIPDHFVVGYGLDFDQKYRNLRCVAVYTEAPSLK